MNTSSGSEGDDPLRESRAYNRSIYLMVAMPYLLLGTIGVLIYRGIKAAQKNQTGLLHDTMEELSPRDRGQPPSATGLD
jgi:hypothetical protein